MMWKERGGLDLDERKRKILQAIIRNYLETGEPVGSRTISKYTDLNLSSATIRNEMSDLEELGYIIQPHTSAGRIPSDKGYRLYVDQMMLEKEEQLSQATQEVREMQKMLLDREDKMEAVLKQMAKMLAVNTNYATMISAPQVQGNKLKFIQLSRVDARQLLTTIVVEGNVIKNDMISVDQMLDDDETLLKRREQHFQVSRACRQSEGERADHDLRGEAAAERARAGYADRREWNGHTGLYRQ